MNAHTPGPWRLSGSYGVIKEEPACCIAKAEPLREMTANARLIAAAPDLLSVVELWLELWDNSYDGEPLTADQAGLLDDARAAIAKARGES